MKICTKCKVEKPFEAFWRSKKASDGYISACIECVNLRRLELKKNPLMQLQKQIRSSVILENKLLKRENKKLCTRCKEVFLIDDLMDGDRCKECNTEISKEYWGKNKEKLKKQNMEHRLKNKEELNKKEREYYEKNKEKIREHNKKYRLKNKEKIKEVQKEYREKNKEKIKEYGKEYRKEYRKEYYEKNKEKAREYRLKNKEKTREYQREHRLKKKLEKQNNT